MTMVLEAQSALEVAALPARHESADAAGALEEIIAAHRQALVELAPHQAWRSVREDTGWHMAELGLLLRVRDSACGARRGHPALAALRAGPAARVRAGMAYRAAGDDPVDVLTTLLPLPQDEIPLKQQKAPAGLVQRPQGHGENTGADHHTR